MQKHGKTRDDLIPDQFDVSFKTLAEMSPTGVHITDTAGMCLYVNHAWCRMAGLTREAAAGDGWIKAIHPEDRSRLFSEWESFIKGTNNWESEYRFIDKAGKITWVYGTATLLKGSKGLAESIIGITINITERKKYETKLKESEERLRLASEATGFGTYSYEFESGKAFYSNEFLALYGLLPVETLELDSDLVAKALYPADRSLFLSKMREANNPRGSGILDIEFRIIRSDGELRWIRSRGQTVFTGSTERDRPLHANGIIQDITERKKNEQNLYESGERYRLFMDNSGLGIGYYDTEGKILMFNKEALKNMGGSETDFVGKNLKDVFGMEKGNYFIERLKLAARSEIPLQFEDKIDLKGDPGWYLSTHMRILNKKGEVEGIQVIANNITQSKIAENNILENIANLSAIFENTKDMIASRDKNNCLLAFNTPFKNIVKKLYGIDAVHGLNTLEFLGKKEEVRWIVIFNEILSGKVYKSELEWDFGSGDIHVYDITISPIIMNNEIIGSLEINSDITERKKALEKIRTGSLYARTLIEASLDPLVTINSEGKITDVNIATERVTGFKRDRLIGSEFADYFVESDKAREGYNIVFSKGVVKDYPLTIRHKNGRTTDVLYNATLFKNDEGIVQGVFAAARDITLRKKMEIKLKNSKKLLEKLNKHLNEIRENERSEIALNLHDDLGQRLTALCLDIAWLKSRIGVQSDPVRNKLEEMIREINETIEGIKELSSFLRPTILYDLGLVPAIKSQLNKFENQSGIKCSFYFDSEEFNVDGKISLVFFRIIQESLTNIVRHSGASAMQVSLKKLENAIEMVIKDDGVGIDNDKVNYLTSMGLEGIRERVKSAHGEVSIRGEKGSGTTIIVTIPIKKRRR